MFLHKLSKCRIASIMSYFAQKVVWFLKMFAPIVMN